MRREHETVTMTPFEILHVYRHPGRKGDLGIPPDFWVAVESQDVQGMQAPSVQAVTAGHGECECSDCDGWTYAWTKWAAER